jgi:hypothetical protein
MYERDNIYYISLSHISPSQREAMYDRERVKYNQGIGEERVYMRERIEGRDNR